MSERILNWPVNWANFSFGEITTRKPRRGCVVEEMVHIQKQMPHGVLLKTPVM